MVQVGVAILLGLTIIERGVVGVALRVRTTNSLMQKDGSH